MTELVINGKFLQRATSRTGVQRVALELVVALDAVLARDADLARAHSCRLIVPGGWLPDLPLARIRMHGVGRWSGLLKGIPWEQFVLPWQARGATVLNFCNLGPVLHRDAFTLIHDAQVHSSPHSYSRAFRAWYRLQQSRLGRHNRAILTVSQYSRDQLHRYGVADASRSLVVHNGCDHVLRLTPDADAPRAFGLDGRRYVVALANTQAHKNIGLLLRAFQSARLGDLTLALFGTATREDFERQGHTVPPNVRFLGRIGDEQLAGLLRQAAALAFPSLTEGFGLPPLEAMALGCPVIAAPCGALPEACGQAALWADPHDPQAWEEHILHLCSDPALAESLRASGRRRAACFTWERAARRLLEIVSSVRVPSAPRREASPARASRPLGDPETTF
ncbi:MAG: glycosyltransferase family 1 protein [Xenophilus sp.]